MADHFDRAAIAVRAAEFLKLDLASELHTVDVRETPFTDAIRAGGALT
jgi:hypothetical protein